jgi:hypothetical protein
MKKEEKEEKAVAKKPTRTVTLPSGKLAEFRSPSGRDVRLARRHCNPATDDIGFAYAVIAQVTMIDGKPIVMEDVDEMSMDDVSVLTKEVLAGNSSTPETSSN